MLESDANLLLSPSTIHNIRVQMYKPSLKRVKNCKDLLIISLRDY